MGRFVCRCECEVTVEARDEGSAEDSALACLEEGFRDCESISCDCECGSEEE